MNHRSRKSGIGTSLLTRKAYWIAGIALCMAACASGGPRSQVRDIDGSPVPPYVVEDVAGPVYRVRCSDGVSYTVVPNPPPFKVGPHVATVLRLRGHDLAGVCQRILAGSVY